MITNFGAVLSVKDGSLPRIESQEFNTIWLPDTRANRKVMLVSLRLLCDENGNSIFTHQDLAAIVLSDNKQASSRHVELFRAGGMDFKSFILHQRKVDEEMVSAVFEELKSEPLAKVGELTDRVKHQLQRDDISKENIDAALEQISFKQVRKSILTRLDKGEAHYKEEYILSEMMDSCETSKKIEKQVVDSPGMSLSDPTAIRKLLTPDLPLKEIDNSTKWVSFLCTLYYHGVSLSVLGKWMKVHKTTILRWVLSLALALWPIISLWLTEKVKAKLAYIEARKALRHSASPKAQSHRVRSG